MRKQYWIKWSDPSWQLTTTGEQDKSYSTKEKAVDAGRIIAKAHQPSELFICKTDGTIADRETYRDDPFPPKG